MTEVGWTNIAQEAKILFLPPEPFPLGEPGGDPVRCPAIQDALKNVFVIRAPFDLKLQYDPGFGVQFADLVDGKLPHFSPETVGRTLLFNPDLRSWRYRDRPIFQISLPYAFFSDTKGVRLTLMPPHQEVKSWPGVVIPGEMNIYDWPARVLQFPFEWHDTSRRFEVKQGDVLCYVKIETPNGDRVKLREVEMHPDLEKVMAQIKGVPSYGGGTRCIFARMANRRPRRLIK